MPETDALRKASPLRRLRSLAVTGLTLALAGGLVAGGTGLLTVRAATEPVAVERTPVAVRTERLRLEDSYEVTVRYRGRIEAGRQVDIGFEAGGTLAEVLVDEGDLVAKGDVLAMSDTRALEAERAAALAARDAILAETELARRTAERQRALAEREHASGQRLDEATLALARLDAELRRAETVIASLDIALEKAVLTAPFDARVGRRAADEGARLAPGQPVLELYEAVAPRLRVGLPAALAATFEPGRAADVEMGGTILEARLDRARTDIDPATRTRDLLFALPEAAEVPDGTLATLAITREVAGEGAWVPTAALGEGVRGLWTLFLVADGVVRREAVEVVHTGEGRAFVRGHLEDGAEVVVAGPHRIAAGQTVLRIGG